jgi:hypothetical protein
MNEIDDEIEESIIVETSEVMVVSNQDYPSGAGSKYTIAVTDLSSDLNGFSLVKPTSFSLEFTYNPMSLEYPCKQFK